MITGQQPISSWGIKATTLGIIFWGGCVSAPTRSLRAASDIQMASTSISATLQDYHARTVASLEDDRADEVSRFVNELRLRIARRDPIEGRALQFKAALDRLQAQRLEDEAQFARTQREIRTIRTASRKLSVAIAQGADLESNLRRLVDTALDRVLAAKLVEGGDGAVESP